MSCCRPSASSPTYGKANQNQLSVLCGRPPWFKSFNATDDVRLDGGHMSGLLTRHNVRWPRWVPRSSPKQTRDLEGRDSNRVFWILGSSDRHLAKLSHPAATRHLAAARRVASRPWLSHGSFGRLVTAEAVRQFRLVGDSARSTAQHPVSERREEPFTASVRALRRGGAVKPRSPKGAPKAQGLRALPRRKTIADAVNREPMCVSPWARALLPSRIQFFCIITDLSISCFVDP